MQFSKKKILETDADSKLTNLRLPWWLDFSQYKTSDLLWTNFNERALLPFLSKESKCLPEHNKRANF